MKATEQYFAVTLFIMLHRVVQPSESACEILNCGDSAVFSWGANL